MEQGQQIRRYLVDGRVQGVGFRWFTLHAALDLGLRGWVRNLSDGRVEALAGGPAPRLEQFEALIRQGPPGSRVSGVQVEPGELRQFAALPSPFSIHR